MLTQGPEKQDGPRPPLFGMVFPKAQAKDQMMLNYLKSQLRQQDKKESRTSIYEQKS
jgi:hypothetical protein